MNYCNQKVNFKIKDMETYMKENNITNFNEQATVNILRQVRDGFQALRCKSVMHRDLKLSNIFIHDELIIIGKYLSFGFLMLR